MDDRALSPDGYIIDQRRTSGLQYGKYASNWNGCGWIAAYNLLLYMGFGCSPEDVNGELAAILPHKGRMGTPVRTMEKYLASRGVGVRCVWTRGRILSAIERAHSGILRYVDEGAPHYVTFVRANGGQWRFFNAIEEDPAHFSTMEEFFRDHAPRYLVRALIPVNSVRADNGKTEIRP